MSPSCNIASMLQSLLPALSDIVPVAHVISSHAFSILLQNAAGTLCPVLQRNCRALASS